MNFVAQLEDYLRDLGAEARKKHPGVKEASERAILRLRTLQNAYVSAVRKASSEGTEHPTTALFQSQDLLHPFLLAANYPNASTKLLDISFGAMRLLMESDAICPGDGIHMIRVWTIQAHVIMSQYLKHNKISNKKHSDGSNNGNNHGSQNNSSSGSGRSSTVSQASAIASTAASWLGVGGFIGGGSSSSSSANGSSNIASDSAVTSTKQLKNAVSSSSGQPGQYNAPSTKDMEKIALEILSCLLKLTELLKSASLSVDLWTQSVSLCCLLLDFRKTVQQAAHSTLPQVLNMLYQTSNSKKYNTQTWEDLLHLASYAPNKKPPSLNGAFSQCRFDTSSSKAPPPPPAEFALELMATVLKERPDILATNDKLLSKTMGVTVALLQQTSNKSLDLAKTLRVFQWTLVVLQTQADASLECRELLMHVIKPIQIAAEVCRSKTDFDDGFVYTGDIASTATAAAASSLGSASNHNAAAAVNKSSRRLSSTTESNNSQQNKVHTCLLPNAVMWKAGLAVETVYHVLLQSGSSTRGGGGGGKPNDNNNAKGLAQVLDRQTIVVLTESLTEFASLGAACKGHIMQLVDVCERTGKRNSSTERNNGGEGHGNNDMLLRTISRDDDQNMPTAIDAMLYIRAEQLVKSGSVSTVFDDTNVSKTSGDKKQSASSASSSSTSQDVLVMGETLWIAFHGILEMVVSVLPHTSPENLESLSEGLFAPCLETLQHFMKRCPGSRDLTRLSLNGYAHLSNLCMPANTAGRSFKRKALLTSLCKMSLPAWGKHDASSQLHNHHVRALICLLRIIHSHYDHILSEWDMVLLTFEELSVMTIASAFLSDQMYHAALAISAVYGRFAPFSTCFSDESFVEFIDALASVSSSVTEQRNLDATNGTSVLDRVLVSSELSKPGEKSSEEGRESTIGGKLVNLGVRAIYGAQSTGEASEHVGSDEMPIAKRTRSSYYEAYRNDFVRRLEATTTASLRPEHVAMLPFGLALLADVAMTNSFRNKVCVAPISKHLCKFASVAPVIRVSVMDTVAMVILAEAAEGDNPISFSSPAKIVFEDPKQHQLLAVEPSKANECDAPKDKVSNVDLFGPICECIQTVDSAVAAEAGITVLTSILENVGHTLTGEVWAVIVRSVASLSGVADERKDADWSNCCMLGFRCLKLIVDDFLDLFPPPSDGVADARSSLLDCCSSYARSRHDVNTSLTAIGLLWTIADQDGGSDAVDRALSKLVALASDSRPEVRNCSVNTLFSCIVGRGKGFTGAQWQSCINGTVFGVYDLVVAKAGDSGDGKVDLDGNAVEKSRSRYKVNVHHSRDSADKQWITTQVLTLQGLSRVLRSFFTQILDHLDDEVTATPETKEMSEDKGDNDDGDDTEGDDEEEESESDSDSEGEDDTSSSYEEGDTSEDTTDTGDEPTEENDNRDVEDENENEKDSELWLVGAWTKILGCALQAAAQEGGRETVDLRNAGVELLVLCGQLSCGAGIQAAITPAKVGAKMQVINGALREVDESEGAKDPAKSLVQRTHSKVISECREALFQRSLQKMERYREFIEISEESKGPSAMEATQVQVLQKFISCLGSLYECCKDDELSQGELGDKQSLIKYFVKPSDAQAGHLECSFVRMLTTVVKCASGGPRFLSPAQRSSIDLLRTMIRHGSSEALLSTVDVAGSWLFFRKDEDKSAPTHDQSAANLVSCELASVVADELPGESVSDTCKALCLWLALSHFPANVIKSDRNSEGRRKAYYKHFLPVLREGLKGAAKIDFEEALKPATLSDQAPERLLLEDIWKKLCDTLTCMLSPIPDTTNLLKISRAQEVLDVVGQSIENVPSESIGDLFSVLSEGAAEALKVERSNRPKAEEKCEGELQRKRVKYREDALLVFKTCYSGMCRRKPDDPSLLAITDKAFTDALATTKASAARNNADDENNNNNNDGVSVDTFLMVCEAFQENPGLEGLIVSSFPLLCQLVQTDHEKVRNAAAAALGSADLRQVLSNARIRYEKAEERAVKAEKEVSELNRAVAELQRKNEKLQQDLA